MALTKPIVAYRNFANPQKKQGQQLQWITVKAYSQFLMGTDPVCSVVGDGASNEASSHVYGRHGKVPR
jgi:hypothetical protein